MVIFSKVRLGVTPEVNALATLVIALVATGVLIAGWMMLRQQKQAGTGPR
jgi:putrescine transport system permease protein